MPLFGPSDRKRAEGGGPANEKQHSRSSGSSSSSPENVQPRRLVKRFRTEVSACMSSLLSTAVAFPLDSVKTRMQTYKYDGFVSCVRHTYKTEKLGGFFRGVNAPLATVTIVRTMSFSFYNESRKLYSSWVEKKFGVDVLSNVKRKNTYPDLWSVSTFGAAGATAGAGITFFACPFELTKLAAQVSVLMSDPKHCPNPSQHAVAKTYQNKGVFKTLGNIVKHRGFMGLYTGFSYHLLRDTIGTGIYFMTYESTKQMFTTLSGERSHASNPLAVLVAGGLCGIVSWAMIYPIDCAKSIYQRNALLYSKGQKVPHVKIEFFRRQMYRGLGVSMGRSCAINAVFFSAFEFCKKQITALPDD